MIAVLAALILVTLAGCALTRLIDRELRGAAFFGSAIFIGCGYAALMMFFLTVVHVEWSRTVVMIALLAPIALLLRRPVFSRPRAPNPVDVVILLIVRGTLREEFDSDLLAAIGTLAIASPALNLWVGLAEGPVMAFGCAGLLLVRRGLARPSNASLHLGAILLGLSAWCKNEGIALIGVTVVAALIVSARRVWRLWPAAAIAGAWMVTRSVYRLQTDFLQGDVLDRMLFHLK